MGVHIVLEALSAYCRNVLSFALRVRVKVITDLQIYG